MSDQNQQQQSKGFFGTATSGLGNTLGAATNTLGKGVGTVTDAAGNVISATGKGVGDTVTGLTQGVGDTTKEMEADKAVAGGNFVKDTSRSGTDSLGLTEAEKKEQAKQ
ncbi:hypothetical protein N0V86_002598 [Didymella sp. IMI 355093]|nr:hypothetical protein N0V86_002598 [Didymella sp. IMI 355093]